MKTYVYFISYEVRPNACKHYVKNDEVELDFEIKNISDVRAIEDKIGIGMNSGITVMHFSLLRNDEV